jgi:hypothetical protein
MWARDESRAALIGAWICPDWRQSRRSDGPGPGLGEYPVPTSPTGLQIKRKDFNAYLSKKKLVLKLITIREVELNVLGYGSQS